VKGRKCEKHKMGRWRDWQKRSDEREIQHKEKEQLPRRE